jgi:Uma2 family endonuclease
MREGPRMSIASKVTIPEAKPAFELIDERLVQKVSPRYSHARLQGVLHGLLSAWAESRGRVGSEWRFALDRPEPGRNSLVPDVAYLSYESLSRDDREAAEEPQMAPDLAVEIISPSDWRGHVDRKTALYLAAGAAVVMEVDPAQRTVVLHDRDSSRTYREGDILEHASLPGFRLDIVALFASIV